jgi:hypothetical protein
MDESDRTAIETQVGLALAALAVAFAKTLRESKPDEDVLVTLQRKAQVAHTQLRETRNAAMAVSIFRSVIEALRNSDVIEQPKD